MHKEQEIISPPLPKPKLNVSDDDYYLCTYTHTSIYWYSYIYCVVFSTM